VSGLAFREKRAKQDVTLNVTSLIDVLFLLLIFFMLTSTFKHQGELELKLPESTTATAPGSEPQTPPVELILTEQGTLLLNGEMTTFEHLESELVELRKSDPAGRVMIEAEEGVAHGQVVKLLDAVRGAGFRGVGIGTSLTPPLPDEGDGSRP